jgi:hypothetical protein
LKGSCDVREGAAVSTPLHLGRASLRTLALAHRQRYASAAPYPHVVVDGFLGESHARELAAAFPGPEHEGWKRRDFEEQSARLGALERNGFEDVAPPLRQLLGELLGMAFLEFLEALTGARGLIADPHYRAAGLKLTLPGGHLALHADFNRDRFRALTRAVTVLYYLNPDWQPEWGGALELWDAQLTRCEARILPVLDRLVVMAHGDTHWHGHPEPLRCPEGTGRRVLTAYYYVAEASPDAPVAHGALWAKPR